MKRVTVPLFQKVMEEKQEVEQVSGELVLSKDNAEVVYTFVRQGSTTPLTISDSCNIDSLAQCFHATQLWITTNRVISVNCKSCLVSIEFANALKPVYLYYHQKELEHALDILQEPQFT